MTKIGTVSITAVSAAPLRGAAADGAWSRPGGGAAPATVEG
jgi:hypothetical protein